MANRIYVEVPKRLGDYRVDVGGKTWDELAAAGAGIGSAVGSIIPGFGTAIGTGIGAISGTIASIFGLASGRDEVRDVMRKIIYGTFASMMPGEVTRTGSARDIAVLPDQYRIEDIRAVLEELRRAVLAELEPGSDIYTDLAAGFSNLVYHEGDWTGGYAVLIFEPQPESIHRPVTAHAPSTTEGNTDASEPPTRNAQSSSSTSGAGGGFSPWLLGGALAVGVILLGD